MTDLERQLVTLLDGKRDRVALTESVVSWRLHLSVNRQFVYRAEDARSAAVASLDCALDNIALQSLLVG